MDGNTVKEMIKEWLDGNVHYGEDRYGCTDDWAKFDPDELQQLLEDCFEDILKELLLRKK